MRACLLCGAKSWHDVMPSELSKLLELTPAEWQGTSINDFFRCDGCNSFAAKNLLTDPEPDAEFSDVGVPPLFSATLGSLLGSVPEPETRLERIVKTVIRGYPPHATDTRAYSEYVVSVARALEREMEKKP